MHQVVYLDILLAVNCTVNAVLLWLTGKLGRMKTRPVRIIIGAVTGSAYLVLLFLPRAEVAESSAVKFACSVVMLMVTYAPVELAKFAMLLCFFYLSSVLLAGTALCIIFLSRSSGTWWTATTAMVNLDVGWWVMAVATLLAVGLGMLLRQVSQRQRWPGQVCLPIVIDFAGQKARVEALLDTGNALSDPLSGRPAIVIEYHAIRGVLPVEIQALYERGGENDWLEAGSALAESEWSDRFSLVPFTAVGKTRGLLLGFRPDQVEVQVRAEAAATKEAIVCISRQKLSAEGRYRALLNPVLVPADEIRHGRKG